MQVNPVTSIKALLTAIIAAISIRFGAMGDLLLLFFAAVSLDYLTGVSSAVYNRELNSGQGLRGVVKKVGVFCVIVVALIADEAAALFAGQLGFTITTHGAISSIVTIWLILNELISVLENIEKMNVALPSFLMSAIKLLKQHTEAGAESEPPKAEPGNPMNPN